MPGPAFFRALGLFLRSGFLEPNVCRQIVAAIRSSPSAEATVVYREGNEQAIDERLRRTRRVHVPPALEQTIVGGLKNVMLEVADHFHLTLGEIQQPQFLVYRPGDFFTLHRDRDDEGRNRRLASVIIFLNSGESEFRGGALKFYGEVSGKLHPFQLPPEEGLLVGFRSEMLHEVEPVTSGERYTIVTWFM